MRRTTLFFAAVVMIFSFAATASAQRLIGAKGFGLDAGNATAGDVAWLSNLGSGGSLLINGGASTPTIADAGILPANIQSILLDLSSSTKGLLLPRTTEAAIVSPTPGLVIYNTTAPGFLDVYTSTGWVSATPTPGTAGDGLVFTAGKYRLGSAAGDPADAFIADRTVSLNAFSLNFGIGAPGTTMLSLNATANTVTASSTANSITAMTGANTLAATLGANTLSAGTTNDLTGATGNSMTATTGDNSLNATVGNNNLNANGPVSMNNITSLSTGSNNVTGPTLINTTLAAATTIGSTATGGAVSVNAAAGGVTVNTGGAGNIVLNPTGTGMINVTGNGGNVTMTNTGANSILIGNAGNKTVVGDAALAGGAPNTTLDVRGSYSLITPGSAIQIGAPYVINATDNVIICNNPLDMEVDLPAPTPGRILIIKSVNAGGISVENGGVFTIDNNIIYNTPYATAPGPAVGYYIAGGGGSVRTFYVGADGDWYIIGN